MSGLKKRYVSSDLGLFGEGTFLSSKPVYRGARTSAPPPTKKCVSADLGLFGERKSASDAKRFVSSDLGLLGERKSDAPPVAEDEGWLKPVYRAVATTSETVMSTPAAATGGSRTWAVVLAMLLAVVAAAAAYGGAFAGALQ
mmetsp:Transcript_20918/g.69102  ORF Transcript_20918/g.69102 Transcript_20918/m.69102 type:complete len:142 (+) Transcript_20918:45-470(+)